MKVNLRLNPPLCLLLTTLCIISCFVASKAQVFRGGEIFQIKDSDIYWAAVKTEYFKDFVAYQEEDLWCWAACVQMVLNYQGVQVDQEAIVNRAKGRRINEAGNAHDIQRAADGWKTGSHIIRAKIDNPMYISAQTFINDLKDKYPLIIGMRMPGQNIGHAYVLTGVSFRKSGDSYQPVEVILRNPSPNSLSREKLSWSEFKNRVQTIVHVYPK